MRTRWDFTRLASLGLATFATAGGVASFTGWAGDIPRLIDWWNTGITMKANSAVCVTADRKSVV